MLGLIQLVNYANVKVDGVIIGEIERGILALIGIEKTDTLDDAAKLIEKILNYRIFPDDQGKMNLSLQDIKGGLLLVPQFTLVAETNKGTRPGFSTGMPPTEGKELFSQFVANAKTRYPNTACGEFGAYMQVTLCNDGPATFILKTK